MNSTFKEGQEVIIKKTNEKVYITGINVSVMGRFVYFTTSSEFDPSYAFYEHELILLNNNKEGNYE